jgi:pyruvate/2-oxoglutarate dehydrogenase complex dihydrolipoamide dehydrogenase (E3) component
MADPFRIVPEDVHNLELRANVHPRTWTNPTPLDRYHLVVIGAGPAGLVAAAAAAGLGAKVALVERLWMGGDCLNVGCVPSKALLRSARAAADVRAAGYFGVEVPPGARVDFVAVMQRMRQVRASLSRSDSAERFQGLGVHVYLGHGRFAGPDAVDVDGKTLHFARALIATGARAAYPDIPGLADVGFLTNETVFGLTALPRRVAVLGAGPVGCELAQALARFGSEVTLLAKSGQVLPREDHDAAQILERALKRDGVRVWTGAATRCVEMRASAKILRVLRFGTEQEVEVDAIVAGTGRLPNVDDLGLDRAGVEFGLKEGIHVDDYLRTNNKRVFAAGDCCSGYRFTHAADAMARAVLRNALFLGRARVSRLTIPWCTYTDPEVAHVGLHEHAATELGFAVQTFTEPLERIDRAVLDGEADGFVRIHTRGRSGQILGATIVGRHAGEIISELSLAMHARIGLGKLSTVIRPYPTQSEAIRRAADTFQRRRLTPWTKWLLARWLAWR